MCLQFSEQYIVKPPCTINSEFAWHKVFIITRKIPMIVVMAFFFSEPAHVSLSLGAYNDDT